MISLIMLAVVSVAQIVVVDLLYFCCKITHFPPGDGESNLVIIGTKTNFAATAAATDRNLHNAITPRTLPPTKTDCLTTGDHSSIASATAILVNLIF